MYIILIIIIGYREFVEDSDTRSETREGGRELTARGAPALESNATCSDLFQALSGPWGLAFPLSAPLRRDCTVTDRSGSSAILQAAASPSCG